MSMARLPMCADWINQSHSEYTLLDAGCRTMAIKPLLKNCSEYFGTDLNPVENVLECNLEKPLPFETDSYDVVTILDVLEHLDNPFGCFRELIRVARKAIYVSLPNMYYISFRWRFLRGQLSGKYLFPVEQIDDRHRWILSYNEAVAFVRHNAAGYDVEIRKILPQRGRTKLIVEPIERWLGNSFPDLFAYGVLFKIDLEKRASPID